VQPGIGWFDRVISIEQAVHVVTPGHWFLGDSHEHFSLRTSG
jgi:hypothetical protein